MFSYEEILDVYRKYRFKLDYDTKQYSLINDSTGQKLEDSEETNKIKGMLYACETMNYYLQHLPNRIDEAQKRRFVEEEFKKLQNALVQIGLRGEHTTSIDESVDGRHSIYNFFNRAIPIYGGRSKLGEDKDLMVKNGYRKESAIHFMNLLLAEKGKKVLDIDDTNATHDVKTTYKLDVQDRSFTEQLNPSNTQYTQEVKPKALSPKYIAGRRNFAEELIAYYKLMESDTAYSERVENEDINMKRVADIVNNHSSISRIPSGKKLMNILMAAKNLSLTGETDYFEYIISQPAVTDLLQEIKKSGRFDKIKQQAEENKQNGKIIHGQLKGHEETVGEACTRIANAEIAQNPNTVPEVKKILANMPQKKYTGFSPEPFIWTAISRTMGHMPKLQRSNGHISFEEDNSITR